MLPAVAAIAPVESMFMYTELVNIAPMGVAASTVYRPYTGLTPASTAFAMPPVTLSMDLVTAALRSPAIPLVLKPWNLKRLAVSAMCCRLTRCLHLCLILFTPSSALIVKRTG